MAAGEDIEGWAAVLWLGGTSTLLLIAAGMCWLRSRSLRDIPGATASNPTATYRTAATRRASPTSEVRVLAMLLLVLWTVTQLLYLGVHIESVQWWLGAGQPPRLSPQLLFWVALINGTFTAGSLHAAWKA